MTREIVMSEWTYVFPVYKRTVIYIFFGAEHAIYGISICRRIYIMLRSNRYRETMNMDFGFYITLIYGVNIMRSYRHFGDAIFTANVLQDGEIWFYAY